MSLSKLIENNFWNNESHLHVQSGGTGGKGGDTMYISPTGDRVISSRPTYSNLNFYYIENLFKINPYAITHDSYWLVQGSTIEYLDFVFQGFIALKSINVCATSHYSNNNQSDRGCNYKIQVGTNGEYRDMTGIIDTSTDHLGLVRKHDICQNVKHIRFYLYSTKTYIALKQIEFWVL